MKPGKLTLIGVAALFAVASVFGQSGDFTVSGKVTDANNQPIVGATITYLSVSKRLSFDFSRADGSFGSGASMTKPQPEKTTRLSMTKSGPVTIDIFDMAGKKIATVVNPNLERGTYSLEAIHSELSQAMYFVKIHANGNSTYQKLINTGTSLRTSSDHTLTSSSSELLLAKRMASVDSVRVGKTGYTPLIVPIASYTDNISTVKLTDKGIEAQVTTLLAAMSQDEKVGQCAMPPYSIDAGTIANNRFGCEFGGGGAFTSNNPTGLANYMDGVQNQMVSGTPRKIPILLGYDGVHGMDVMPGGTIFPHNMGVGAIQDSNLVMKAFRVAGIEMRGTGCNWTFGPCIAVIRDDRWGRAYEGFSETPALTAKFARWAVLGLQTSDLSHPWNVAACTKHFAGDGGTANGVNPGRTSGDDNSAAPIHLPGYISAVNAGTATIMPSFSTWADGTAMHANSKLMTGWLKNGNTVGGVAGTRFDGFVVGDYDADQAAGSTAASMNAGLDVPMAPRYGTGVKGNISPCTRIDDACKRVLRVKLRMNLMNQYIVDRRITSTVGSTEHRDVARACVRASLVLLKSTNSVLPITPSTNVAVWGTGSDNLGIQCGGWTASGTPDSWQGSTTAHGIPGVTIYQGIQSLCKGTVTYSADGSNSGNATTIVAVLSEDPYAEKSYSNISLTQDKNSSTNQNVINNIAAAHSAGKKVIVVLMAGRPLDIGPVINNCDAFVWACLPGSEGKGVAEVFFNDQGYRFTGKLPISWPNTAANPVDGGARYPLGTGITPF
jgi:beta-glucosidase